MSGKYVTSMYSQFHNSVIYLIHSCSFNILPYIRILDVLRFLHSRQILNDALRIIQSVEKFYVHLFMFEKFAFSNPPFLFLTQRATIPPLHIDIIQCMDAPTVLTVIVHISFNFCLVHVLIHLTLLCPVTFLPEAGATQDKNCSLQYENIFASVLSL